MPSTNAPLQYQGWKILGTAFGLALDSIRAHKLRSALTLLGIVIGVASVILVGSAIEGMGVYAETTTSRVFGSNSFVIAQIANQGRLTRTERAELLRYNRRIRKDDLAYLRLVTGDDMIYSSYAQTFDDVQRVVGTSTAEYESAAILGVSAELADIRDITVSDGRFFTIQEERARQDVAVIGDEIRQTLFGATSPIDGVIRIRGREFRVTGVQERLGSSGPQSPDSQVYIPAAAFDKLFNPPDSLTVFASATEESGLTQDAAIELVRAALRSRYKTRPGAEDNFGLLTPDSVRAFVDQILSLVAAVVVPITAISLVVGGIVIMNIMLVSVTERTREIGIRKALGARNSDIRMQFLVEATILAAVGGVIGLTLGALVARGLGIVLGTELPVTLPYAAIAIFVSSVTGLVSGWYPANRASHLDPVEAMRAE